MKFRHSLLAVSLTAAMLTGCNTVTTKQSDSAVQAAVTPHAVLENYAAIAHATYEDSLLTARAMQQAIDTFLAAPTEANLAKARAAWVAARVPYQQSEAFRFGNAVVDEWEGRVNAWPLDEGLIDYVATAYGSESDENPFYAANIIANRTLHLGGQEIDASEINKALLQQLHEVDEVEANVATGYHAIEFLLWGQDLNGTNPGAGNRPASDFDPNNCSNGHCERRAAYLRVATELLIDDLEEMVTAWKEGGAGREELFGKGGQAGLATILTGMGSLAYGELAGERTRLGLMLHDPEEEHDCFADNTHWSHYYDAKGIQNVYLGRYSRVDGSVVSGASLSDLVQRTAPALDSSLRARLDSTQRAAQTMVDEAAKGNTFDVLIGAGNQQGNQVVQRFVDALVDETRVIEQVIAALKLDGIALEGSDSLDNPAAVLAQ